MLGAFIGDIAGSFREFSLNKYPELGLLPSRDDVYNNTTAGKRYGITDDSVLTFATMSALLCIDESPNISDAEIQKIFSDQYRSIGNQYKDPIGGYGGGFLQWLNSVNDSPYNSCGNGSAMRVSPVAYAAASMDAAVKLSYLSSACTHNHPEGIKGAQATAVMIYLAKNNQVNFEDINGYLHGKYLGYAPVEQFDHFDSVCPDTMRLVTHILMTTNSFHDAVFKAVTTPNGDSDTLGAIVGSIAEAMYGIPDEIKDYAMTFIADPLFVKLHKSFNDRFQA